MKNKSKMKTLRQNGWRRLGGSALLLCAMTGIPASFAAETARDEAVLNFAGADIESVIKAVGHYTNMTFIIDPRVKGTINLVSEKPVTKAQAFSLLSSALRLQGFTIVIGDGFAKVVPESDAKLQSGPIQTGAVRGDQIATQIYRLNYESAPNLVTVLRPLISPNNTINANPGNNSLVITDYADNLKRLGKIIAALDTPANGGDLDIIPIRYAIASDIAVMTNRLMEPAPAAGGGAERVSVLADSRTNSVIVRAPSPARANLARSLISRLDQPTSQPGNVHVVYLKNADATKLAQTLRAVVTLDTSAASPSSSPASAAPSSQPGAASGGLMSGAPSSSSSSSSQASLPAGGAAGFIQADVSTNTLIITASEPVYRNLRAVIDQLDARRAQVYIESLIAEVSDDKAAEFGIQWLGATGNSSSTYRVGGAQVFDNAVNNNLLTLAKAGKAAVPGGGLSLGVFRQVGGTLGLGAIAHAMSNDSGSNILSTPNLITLDNEEAKIIVGQNVPFITGSFTTGASGATSNPFQTIERKDVGLALRVKPQISEGGTVKMAIYQETSSVDPASKNDTAGLTTNKRSIETNVLVDDGQIIVLGGLITDETSDSNDKIPGLGDIPIIGNLFKYQTRTRTKKNLMVFLRPTIVRTNEQSVNLMSDRYEYIRNEQIKGQPEQKLVLPDMGAPLIPTLENGQPTNGDLFIKNPGKAGVVSPIPPAVPAPTPDSTPKQ
ncbi:MAG TPA: type II secretion system secretin GspD [Burkholderiaceae bacterium]|jgi:general secretion pathway protein D